jgi:hypothetical protein
VLRSLVKRDLRSDLGEPLGVRLLFDPALGGDYADFDNVQLTAAGELVFVHDHDFENQRNGLEGNPASNLAPFLGRPWESVGLPSQTRRIYDPDSNDGTYMDPNVDNSNNCVLGTMDSPTIFFMCDSGPGCPAASDAFGIGQILHTAVANDSGYLLIVSIGNRDGLVGTYGGWGVQLLAGNSVRAELHSDDIPPLPVGTFSDVSVSSTSNVSEDPNLGEPLGVRLLFDPALGGDYSDFDNVRVVPEPEGLIGLIAGALLLGYLTRRRGGTPVTPRANG